MLKGVVKMYDTHKGFGFITSEDDDDLFFTLGDIHPKFKNRPMHEGMTVGYDLKREMRGDRAINIRIIT